MGDATPTDVLAANEAFYAAFSAGDIEVLKDCFASGPGIAVIHPGWPAIHGRDEVIESFRRILSGPSPPAIHCDDAVAYVHGGAAFVICTEHLADGDLVATNFFVQEHEAWRIVHHQAGPQPAPVPSDPETTVH